MLELVPQLRLEPFSGLFLLPACCADERMSLQMFNQGTARRISNAMSELLDVLMKLAYLNILAAVKQPARTQPGRELLFTSPI